MTQKEKENTEAGAAIDMMERYHTVELQAIEEPSANTAGQALVLPHGMRIESLRKYLDEYRTKPRRIEGVAQLEDVGSFIEYVRKFSDPLHSKLFAATGVDSQGGLPTPKLVAVIDHHHTSDEPRFGAHRAEYNFPLSEPFKAWLAANESTLSLEMFANFLEDRLMDVLDPARLPSDGIKEAVQRLGLKLADPGQLLRSTGSRITASPRRRSRTRWSDAACGAPKRPLGFSAVCFPAARANARSGARLG